MALVAFDIESIEQDFIDVATIEDSGPRLVPANVPQISYRVTVRRNTITGTTPLTTQTNWTHTTHSRRVSAIAFWMSSASWAS